MITEGLNLLHHLATRLLSHWAIWISIAPWSHRKSITFSLTSANPMDMVKRNYSTGCQYNELMPLWNWCIFNHLLCNTTATSVDTFYFQLYFVLLNNVGVTYILLKKKCFCDILFLVFVVYTKYVTCNCCPKFSSMLLTRLSWCHISWEKWILLMQRVEGVLTLIFL